MLNIFVEYWWQFLIVCIGSYFVGATNFAVIFSRLFKSQDVRKVGSGNAGATNMFRVYGLALGVLTFLCDVLKGVVCILIAKWVFTNSLDSQALTQLLYFAGLFAVVGHVFPLYYNFRGGKGVAAAVGCVFCLHPLLALSLVVPSVLLILITDRTAIASLFISFVMLVWSWVQLSAQTDAICAICFTVIFALVLFAHRGNIARLMTGKEKKTGIVKAIFSKKDKSN